MIKYLKYIIAKDRKAVLIYGALLILAFLIGLSINGSDSHEGHEHEMDVVMESENSIWTCSMHPQIKQPKSGQCPICGMDLVSVALSDIEEGPREIKLSEQAQKLAEIDVAAVERKFVEKEIRMVGKIENDETRVSYITTWVPGRIDKLYVNYTGISVRKGDHLAELYSPEILSTHEELLQSLKTVQSVSTNEYVGTTAINQLNSVRERLRLWGLSSRQIARMEKSRQPADHITLYSPMSGIVIHKNAQEGMYVKTGTKIFTISDLSKLWLKMDAYESDITWLRYGQEVKFHTEAFPGEIFRGRISFIEPVLNPQTRTIKIRVNVDNPDGRLKPEMFVHAIVRSKITADNQVMSADLAGKWISPMHPEIVKNKPGKCDVCGMMLVKAETLGYESSKNASAPLVIPVSAPLITGKRAVVYVKVNGKNGVFEGREIELGLRAGNYYIVKSGLREGEQVVVNGNFKIDSAIQIQAKQSMMNPEGDGSAPGHHHGSEAPKAPQPKHDAKKMFEAPETFKKQLDAVYKVYFELHDLLSHDKFDEAKTKTKDLAKTLKGVDKSLLDHQSHLAWMKYVEGLQEGTDAIGNSSDIDGARKSFETVSINIIDTAKSFGSNTHSLFVYHCPMAFNNKGADWLQHKEGTANPYFGSSMFKCGDKKADLTTAVKADDHRGHEND